MFINISSHRNAAFFGSLSQLISVSNQHIDGVDTSVEVVFNFIEITTVVLANALWNIAFRDTVNIICRHIQRTNHRVQGVIHAFNNFAEIAIVFGGISTRRQLAIHSCF